MDNEFKDAENNGQSNDDKLHSLSTNKTKKELQGVSTSIITGLKSKRLIRWVNLKHSHISKIYPKDPFFKNSHGLESRIPKHMVRVDERYLRRCLQLIHLSASKTARCNLSANLSSTKLDFFSDSLNISEIRSGDTLDSSRIVLECPMDAGCESVIVSPAGRWVSGAIMGNKSVLNILKSPLFHKYGHLDSNENFIKIDSNDVNGSFCYDFAESPRVLCLSSSEKLDEGTPPVGWYKHGSDTAQQRPVSMSSTFSVCSDKSSSSASATVTQGMLQCTWKDGNPHFVFSTDDQRDVCVANLWRVGSKDDKSLEYVYLFHSGKGGHKHHEICDSTSHLVGKMKVSKSFTLCQNNSKIMETEFVLYGSGDNSLLEMHASGGNLRKSKGLSKKVVKVFRTSHPSKKKSKSKFQSSSTILENFSTEPCPETGDNLDAAGVSMSLEDHPPNFELAAIVVKDHVPEHKKEEVGGWGLKFLKKVGIKQSAKPAEASVTFECCGDGGHCSTSMDILIPAGLHGGPRTRNGGPSSLIERWRSGGHCDCGGWDMGCPLTVLTSRSSKEEIFPDMKIQGCRSFDFIIQVYHPPKRIF